MTWQAAGSRRWLSPGLRLGTGIGPGQGTTQRFVLLLVLFITGSVNLLGLAFEQVVDPRGYGLACELAAGFDPNADNPANGLDIAAPAFNDCLTLHASGWRYVWLPLAATGLVVALAIAHYALYPRWQRRRRNLVPLERSDPGGLVAEALADLKSRAGLTASLDYVVDLSAGSPSARVFGRPGNYAVCLNAGLIALFGRDPDAFAATMLHEFAHVSNRDIGITYLTVAIWRVFLVCAVTPFAITQAYSFASGLLARHPSPFLPGRLPNEAGNIALAAAIVALVYLAMADVLRSREHYADLGAVGLGADRVYWLRHVPAVPVPARSGIVRELRAALRVHPSWEKRHAVLVRSSDVHLVGASTMFVTGMAGQLLAGFMGDAPIGMSYSWIQDNAIWPAAGLTAAVAGLAVWRNAAVEVAAGRPAPSGLRAGLWLGVGQLAGELLLSEATGNAWFPPFPWVLVSVLLILVPAAILWWTAGCAARWSQRGGLRGWGAGAVTMAVATAAFAWWFEWWQAAGTLYIQGNPEPVSVTFADYLSSFPHTTTTEVVAAVLGPVSDLQIADWGIWLTAALLILPLIAARPRDAGVIGAWTGCAAAVAIVFITFRAHGWISHGSLTFGQNYFIYDAWIFGILLCATVAAAVLASLRGDGLAAPAMAGAGIAAALSLAAVVATFGTDGCIGPLAVVHERCALSADMNWDISSDIVQLLLTMLGMLALVVAATTAGIMRMARDGERGQDAGTAPSPAAPARPIRRRLARTGLCLACLVLAGLSVPAYVSATASDSGDPSGGQGQADPAPPGTGSAQLQAIQLAAWGGMGGEDILFGLDDDARKLATLDPSGSARATGSKSTCSAIMSVSAKAKAYLPPPDQLVAQSWSTVISEASTGAQECLTGFSQHDSSLVTSGIIEIYDADHLINTMFGQIDDDLHAS